MRHAQIGQAFQWILVLVAGGSFLIVFFFAFRSCTDLSGQQADALSLRATAGTISSAAWGSEGDQNITAADSEAICPAGILTLVKDEAQAPLPGVPAFLSPDLGGRLHLRTENVVMGEHPSTFPLGNAVVGEAEGTLYVVIEDSLGEHQRFTLPARRMHKEDVLEGIDVASGMDTVIFVSFSDELRLERVPVPEDVLVLGVSVRRATADGGSLRFYTVRDGALAPGGEVPYYGDALMLGGVVTAREREYLCGMQAFAARARAITTIAERRAREIAPTADPFCARPFEEAISALERVNAATTPGMFLERIDDESELLVRQQRALITSACPVIA